MILGLDPGTTQSGWCLYDPAKHTVADCGVHPNHDVLRWIQAGQGAATLAIEMMLARGMPTSNDEFKTLVWVGRFVQAWREPERVELVHRGEVKMHVCGQMKANDKNVRAGLIELFPPTGAGSVRQIGTKAHPGPLYGVSSHAWPALGVAVTAAHKLGITPLHVEQETA